MKEAAGSPVVFIGDRRERDATVPTPSVLHLNLDGVWKALWLRNWKEGCGARQVSAESCDPMAAAARAGFLLGALGEASSHSARLPARGTGLL